jgi:hypothetical protein
VSECQNADWHQIGFVDGSRGTPKNVFAEYVNSCTAYYIVPDKDAYEIGYQEGIASYCSYKNGEYLGQQNKLFRDTCPEYLKAELASGFKAGKALYDLDQKIQVQEKKISTLTRQLIDPKTPEKDKPRLKQELNKTTEQLVQNKSQQTKLLENSPNNTSRRATQNASAAVEFNPSEVPTHRQ